MGSRKTLHRQLHLDSDNQPLFSLAVIIIIIIQASRSAEPHSIDGKVFKSQLLMCKLWVV